MSEEHPSKAFFSMEATEEGIEIYVKDEHFAKAFSLIEVTDEG